MDDVLHVLHVLHLRTLSRRGEITVDDGCSGWEGGRRLSVVPEGDAMGLGRRRPHWTDDGSVMLLLRR